MSIAITTIYASLCGLLIVIQGLNVSRLRRARKISLGDGDDKDVRIAIRIHANTIENAPIAVLLLLLYEMGGATGWVLHLFGAGFLVVRLAHQYGMATGRKVSAARVVGAAGTWTIIGALAVVNLVQALG